MSQARICDKCNKILKCAPSVKIWIDFHYNGSAEYELCEECKSKLIKWLGENRHDMYGDKAFGPGVFKEKA